MLLQQDIYSDKDFKTGTTLEMAREFWLSLSPERIARIATYYDLAARKNAAEQQLRELKKDETVKRDLINAEIKMLDKESKTLGDDANTLFFNLREELLKLIGSKTPKYTDQQKFLIMYAQMHRTLSAYANGRTFDYRYADDRNDILSKAEECLEKMAAFIRLARR